MRHIVTILFIILPLVVFILNLYYIGQFVVLAVITRPCAWSFFFAFGWLSMFVFFLTIVEDVWSAIKGKQR